MKYAWELFRATLKVSCFGQLEGTEGVFSLIASNVEESDDLVFFGFLADSKSIAEPLKTFFPFRPFIRR